jgi:hypothetical protein
MPNEQPGDAFVAGALHAQMRVRYVERLPELAGPLLLSDGYLDLARSGFRFRSDGGTAFHYERGAGISAIRPGPDIVDEFEVYLWGTVFGAVAWLNGYFPLHASAVELDGRAIAFTADSGGGKSTLAAALAAGGMPHICDDTLPLARCDDRLLAVPDLKPVKLWEDGLALTGTPSDRPIAAVPGKHFARPSHRATGPLPLTDLFVLEEGATVAVERLTGAAGLAALAGSLYRPGIAQALVDPQEYGDWLLLLGKTVRTWRLARPRTPNDQPGFAQTTRRIARVVCAL